jgi:adenine-specific DNA-methyltransferase
LAALRCVAFHFTEFPMLDIACHGQVFTPPAIVEAMLRLRRNAGRVLEPACGDGAFSSRLPGSVAIELDARHCPPDALNLDFFAYPETERFDTIIGNPPYVKARDILPATRRHLGSQLLNGHANLYLFFIEKCVRHLNPGGELIFITPRDFLKATGAARLNAWLHDQGTLTDFEELGDARVFDGVVPNCAIWRFEKGNLKRRLADGRRMVLAGGQILLTRGIYSVPLASVFSVKVGAVSGADDIFANAELGNADFVCSKTAQTGELRRMIFLDREGPIEYLLPFKERLLARKVTRFDEANWWKWGRRHFVSPMVPHLTTALTGPLLDLERTFLDRATAIEQWFRAQWQEHTPPFYGSVDLRNSGFKLAPVDTNLFPGGFNNLNPAFLPLCVQAAMSAIEKICPDAKQPAADPREPHAQPVLPAERGAPGDDPATAPA